MFTNLTSFRNGAHGITIANSQPVTLTSSVFADNGETNVEVLQGEADLHSADDTLDVLVQGCTLSASISKCYLA